MRKNICRLSTFEEQSGSKQEFQILCFAQKYFEPFRGSEQLQLKYDCWKDGGRNGFNMEDAFEKIKEVGERNAGVVTTKQIEAVEIRRGLIKIR